MKKKFQKTPLIMPSLPVNSSPSALRFRGVRPRRNTAEKFPAPRPAHHIQQQQEEHKNARLQETSISARADRHAKICEIRCKHKKKTHEVFWKSNRVRNQINLRL